MDSQWDKERTFEIEKVSTVYLVTALCVVPFAIYYLLNFLSPLVHRITAMRISEVCFAEFYEMWVADRVEDICLSYQISTRSESK
jgi:hypothetical protein